MARRFVAASSQYAQRLGAPVTGVPLTLALWIKTSNTLQTTYQGALCHGTTNGWFTASLTNLSTGTVQAYAYDGTTVASARSAAVAPANTWFHICAVFTSLSSRAVYLNGGGKVTDATVGTAPAIDRVTLANLFFGGALLGNYFDGDLAELAIWNAALSDAEAAQLATGVAATAVRPANLAAYYPLIGLTSPEPDVMGGTAMTLVNGPTAAPHPPLIASVDYLIVGGGGGGGTGNGVPNGASGGGGAGGLLTGTDTGVSGAWSVIVGNGGASDTNGGDSVFNSHTAVGGGHGGHYSTNTAAAGGSGGGGGGHTASTFAGGSGTAGQGNAGGAGGANPSTPGSGGGGGAGAVGATGGINVGGNGGAGTSSSISGAAVTYAGGGGGGQWQSGGQNGVGGSGGGGAGNDGGAGGAGTANRGSGGGGGNPGGAGGSGIVVLAYVTGTLTATGGTITTAGARTIHTFTSSGTFALAGAGAAAGRMFAVF